jgi:hypothetical protein
MGYMYNFTTNSTIHQCGISFYLDICRFSECGSPEQEQSPALSEAWLSAMVNV